MSTIAQRVLLPADPTVFRTAFLYVGQGDATLHVIPDGNGGRIFALVDINHDVERGGIDVVKVLEDLLPSEGGRPVLDIFINTHPHRDHLCGLKELRKRLSVKEVWHTGFEPGDKHEEAFGDLRALIKDVVAERGPNGEFEYEGTRQTKTVGKVEVEIVSPAAHVKDEISQLKGEDRDCRIHEHCGVFRLAYGSSPKHVLLTGDSDKAAWKDHILAEDYHKDRIPAAALSASHHGSRTFFKIDEDDPEPYEHHLEIITPTWVVISSPTKEESQHGHPHDDAVALYEKHVKGGNPANVIVLGKTKETRLYDIYDNGQHVMGTDHGDLIANYSLRKDGGNGGPAGGRSAAVITRVDKGNPMGSSPDQ